MRRGPRSYKYRVKYVRRDPGGVFGFRPASSAHPPGSPHLHLIHAVDLTGYRDKVRDAVLRLENLPMAMETF